MTIVKRQYMTLIGQTYIEKYNAIVEIYCRYKDNMWFLKHGDKIDGPYENMEILIEELPSTAEHHTFYQDHEQLSLTLEYSDPPSQ